MVERCVMMYNSQSGTVTPMEFKSYPIIPLVYSDALSYLETVSKITQKVNEVIECVNTFENDILTKSKTYTDNEVQKALGDVSNTVQELYQMKSDLQTQYNTFVKLTNDQLVVFNSQLKDTNTRIDDAIIGVNKRTDLAIEQNNEYLLKNLRQYLSQIEVINFFTGETIGIQTMFDYLCMLHVENGMNYEHLVNKELTYDVLCGFGMTYTDMVLNGKTLIG